jgi:uncharacterized protein YndB with AHSA1/START domain
VPTAHGTRTIAALPGQLWDVLSDPHHLPRWWPRVQRVEAVGEQDFTQVLISEKGKMVRADFKLVDVVTERRVVWAQQIEGTPFARVLKSAETEITLAGAGAGGAAEAEAGAGAGHATGVTESAVAGGDRRSDAAASFGSASDAPMSVVTIELRQELQGFRGSGVLSMRLTGIASFGSPLVRRAAHTTIEEALDGLERIVGGDST